MEYKYSYRRPERTPGALTVVSAGVQRCQPGHSWGPGVRDHYLLHYVVRGEGILIGREQTHALGAGDLFLAAPDETIFYRADDVHPWEYRWTGFYGSEAGMLLGQTDFADGRLVLHGASMQIADEMTAIYEAGGNRPEQNAFMTGGMYRLLGILIRDRTLRPTHPSSESVNRAVEFIQGNYALSISVEDIARHVGLSRSRLYRLFREQLRLSPVDVLTQVRMRQACMLLRRRSMSIKAVAASVGYEDQLYFSRRFREIVGMSPREYAQSAE